MSNIYGKYVYMYMDSSAVRTRLATHSAYCRCVPVYKSFQQGGVHTFDVLQQALSITNKCCRYFQRRQRHNGKTDVLPPEHIFDTYWPQQDRSTHPSRASNDLAGVLARSALGVRDRPLLP